MSGQQEFIPSAVRARISLASSRITDAVIDKAKEWQNRPLEPIYAIVFMDALFLKLRVDGRVKNVAAYLMVGIGKECLGIWLGQSESAKYWLGVLNEVVRLGWTGWRRG